MQANVPHNHFTGEPGVPMTATFLEVETMYGACDRVKDLSASGELAALHNRVNDLRESSSSTYLNIRGRLEKVIETCE